jgi:hypothetical protein
MTEVRVLSSAEITRPQRSCDPVRLPPGPPPSAVSKPRPPTGWASPDYPFHPSRVPRPIPRRIEWLRVSMLRHPYCLPRFEGGSASASLPFEACSDFTHVAARWIAQPPKAAFVTRLRSSQSPSQTARQLPGQSTITWVEPPSTGQTRLRGAPQKSPIFTRKPCFKCLDLCNMALLLSRNRACG